ncbi:hypothetical protein EUGRSUZ_C04024 [Eucalyptus grandis]|uniref:Uncharacterized protein n=2 Tax=Eucalyptus grandis TaxID=71139 RepID=A0ACC3LKR7_EUCGR|nr:hypothetical protein EUGRSUZ_C04024 [Eucalyptus grandis]
MPPVPSSNSGTFLRCRCHPIHRFLLQTTLTTIEALVEDGTYGKHGDFPLSKLLAMEELNLDYSKVGALSRRCRGR